MASTFALRRPPLLSNAVLDNPSRLLDPQEACGKCALSYSRFPGFRNSLHRSKESQAGFFRIVQNLSPLQLSERSWGQVASATSIPSQTQLQAEVPLSTGISVGKLALQGPREEMEDDFVVEPNAPKGFTYVGVFDGHAGFSAVQFLREELYKECISALDGGTLLEIDDSSGAEAAVASAFLQTDERLLARLQEPGVQKESGATATVLFAREDRLLVAHVGDSRAVLCRAGKAEQLSEDHRPYSNKKKSLAEVQRIKDAGGWVTHGRVCGNLSVSRAFGDISFKTERKQFIEQGVKMRSWTSAFASSVDVKGDWITALPDISCMEVTPDMEFLIVATDGLWDSLNSDEAVRLARRLLKKHGNVQLTCETLAQRALDRNGQDNVTIVILDFGRRPQEDETWWSKLVDYVSSLLDL